MSIRLADFGADLTARARAGRLDPVYCREKEVARVVRILVRRTKNNPVLVGEPGVGKTAIVEELAHRIAEGRVPRTLGGMTVFSLDLGSLVAGTGYRGDFEQRLRELVSEIRRPGAQILLFVDELHLLGRAGRSEGGIDAGNLLKPLLARGELPCIGASTPDEWRRWVASDPALERRFQPVSVPEPSAAETLVMLRGLRARYEEHHGVAITDDALQAAVASSVDMMPNRRLPDKAVDLLDEACAMVRLSGDSPPDTDWIAASGELAAAEDRFDLDAVARLRYKVLPALRAARRPLLQRAAIDQICSGLRNGLDLEG